MFARVERTLGRGHNHVYDVVEPSDVERTLSSAPAYINDVYLRLFLKYKIFSSDVQWKLMRKQRGGSLSQLQFREIVEDSYTNVFKIDRAVDAVLRDYERAVASLFIVKFSVAFNYFYRLYNFERDMTHSKTSFASFLQRLFDEPVSGCLQSSANMDDFMDRLERDFERIYHLDLRKSDLGRPKAITASPQEAGEKGQSVLQFFDVSHYYQKHLVQLLQNMDDLKVDDAPRVVKELLEVMNYQMHMAISSPVINGVSEQFPQRWRQTWTFLTLCGWTLCQPVTFAVTFSPSCTDNYHVFLKALDIVKVGDDVAPIIKNLKLALKAAAKGVSANELFDDDMSEEALGKLVAYTVCHAANRLQSSINEYRDKRSLRYCIYHYCFENLNGIDTHSGIDFFLNKKVLRQSAFRSCPFTSVERLTKDTPCSYWLSRAELWGVLRDNRRDLDDVVQLIESVDSMEARKKAVDERQREWLATISQRDKRSDELPEPARLEDTEDYEDDDRSLLCDLLEMHVDIVLSVLFLLLLYVQRVMMAPLTLDTCALCTLMATCTQTANFGIEGTLDMLEFLEQLANSNRPSRLTQQ